MGRWRMILLIRERHCIDFLLCDNDFMLLYEFTECEYSIPRTRNTGWANVLLTLRSNGFNHT